MKTDLYTKVILTVIAISLVTIILKDINITPTATAQTGSRGVIDVNIVSINGSRVFGGKLDVNVENKVDINLPYEGLNVNVKNYRDFK